MRSLGLAILLMATTDTLAAFTFDPYQTRAIDSRPDAIAIGDIDGDRRDDVVLTARHPVGGANEIFVFFQRADGTLAPAIRQVYGNGYWGFTGLALVDMNRDGIRDVVVGHAGGITLFQGNARRRLVARTISGPPVGGVVVGTADVDRDGYLDVIRQSQAEGATIFHGDGRGGIQRQSHLPTLAKGGYNDLEIGDLNADGFADLAISSGYGGAIYIHLHDGVSGYVATPLTIQTDYFPSVLGGLAMGDFNGDGRQDLAVAKSSNSPTHVAVYHQTENGSFATPVNFTTYDVPAAMHGADMDGDGHDDLLVAHNGWGAIGLYRQIDAGLQAEDLAAAVASRSHAGLAVGDINGDGCKDAAMAHPFVGLVLLYGSGCEKSPDLVVTVGLTPSIAAIRLEHASGTTQIDQPLVRIDLSIQSGSLQTGTLPADCVLQVQTATTRRIECLVASLASGGDSTLIIPLGVSPSASSNALRVYAQAQTTTPELSFSNNHAWKRVSLPPEPPSPSLVETRRLRPQCLLRTSDPDCRIPRHHNAAER